MIRVSNKNARDCVENRVEFQGSNLYGRIERPKNQSDSCLYVVYSYGPHYPMFIAEWEHNKPDTVKWYENAEKSSRSIESQRSQCRPLDCEIKLMSNEDMERLRKFGIVGVVLQLGTWSQEYISDWIQGS